MLDVISATQKPNRAKAMEVEKTRDIPTGKMSFGQRHEGGENEPCGYQRT